MSDSVRGFEYNSELYMRKKFLDLSSELLLDNRRQMRNKRKMEKNSGLWKKNAMVISSIMEWRCRKKKAPYVHYDVIIERICLGTGVMLGDKSMELFIYDSEWERIFQQEMLNVCNFYVEILV